jgi:hypothetical protein
LADCAQDEDSKAFLSPWFAPIFAPDFENAQEFIQISSGTSKIGYMHKTLTNTVGLRLL